MSPDLTRLLELVRAATPGERCVRSDAPFQDGTPYCHIAAGIGFFDTPETGGFGISGVMSEADAQFMAISPETWATLIRRLIAAEAVVEAARQLNEFAKKAPKLDFNEDINLTGPAIFVAYVDSLLATHAATKDTAP